MNYIVLNNEKIVIDIENGLSFYKEKNNKLYPLNEKEFLYIKNYLIEMIIILKV